MLCYSGITLESSLLCISNQPPDRSVRCTPILPAPFVPQRPPLGAHHIPPVAEFPGAQECVANALPLIWSHSLLSFWSHPTVPYLAEILNNSLVNTAYHFFSSPVCKMGSTPCFFAFLCFHRSAYHLLENRLEQSMSYSFWVACHGPLPFQ